MMAVSSNKENVLSSTTTASKPANGRGGGGGGDDGALSLVELNSTVIGLIEENEEMLQTIAALSEKNAVMEAKLEHTSRLEREVNALRAELGYVTADTTDTKYKAQNYKKLYEDLLVTNSRLQKDYAITKQLLDEATAKERAARGVDGYSRASLDHLKRREEFVSQETHGQEAVSALRIHKVVLERAREVFAHLCNDPKCTAQSAKEKMEALSQVLAKYSTRPGGKEMSGDEAVPPSVQHGQELLKFMQTLLEAYAKEKFAKAPSTRK